MIPAFRVRISEMNVLAKGMTRFEPFHGLRYDVTLAPLPEVISPPYDVVDATERKELAARSPYNAIHVELPEPEGDLDRYAHAAQLFGQWQELGGLCLDETPSLYLYRMSFIDELGAARATTGVIGALAIDFEGAGTVLPHERTMPKPKGDRLDLLRATKMNVSPIWGLSLASGLAEELAAITQTTAPIGSAADDEETTHELWVVSNPLAIKKICALIATTPIVVADGHHRYETAGYYRAEVREANGDQPGAHDLLMALIVELTPNELVVQGIHRLISALPEDFDIVDAFSPWFSISEGPSDIRDLSSALVPAGALGLVTKGGNYLMVPSAELVAKADADLDSSRLDEALASLPEHTLVYQHGTSNCARLVEDGAAQFAVLLRPATVAQIAETAHSGKRMPPKTTFFNPKPRTGMVYRPVS
jgi:uncharacterized protein (DUF1015 family)